ncbi:hypothetical protein IJH33_01515 [Candidatus Saccharibacteria bacterium]|nr:hypothetical protein [Candidatus Saccharibacteria bacterium]
MADYVLARKSRNIASNAVHVLLNILLGMGAVLVTVFSASPILGVILVLVSKWRVFAVRRRYLWLNIKSNLVDLIVGLSVVFLAYSAGGSLMLVDGILMAVYVVWLLFIKPLSSENANLVQALFAVFLGISASTLMSAYLNPVVSVLLAFLIGYAASRHVLVQTGDEDFSLTTLVCGLVFAEVAWMCNIWGIVYPIEWPGFSTGIIIPQAAVVLTIFAFVYNYVRQVATKYQEDFRFRDVVVPVVFGIVLIGVIVLVFSPARYNV